MIDMSRQNIFGKILDYYFVTEFQNRGSEHDHGLLWIQDAPIYGKNNNLEIENFVDRYITCDMDFLDPNLSKFHEHHHTKSCKKRKNFHGRYNFPMPLMKRTRVLEPINTTYEKLIEKARLLYTLLEQKRYDKSTTFEVILDELDLTESDYIKVIQSMLKQPMIFLK